jgi:hypothetical protein
MKEFQVIQDVMHPLDAEPKHAAPIVGAEIRVRVAAIFLLREYFPEIPDRVFVQKGSELVGFVRRDCFQAEELHPKGVLPGFPISESAYFVCPKGDCLLRINDYDASNPPRCPNHGIVLQQWRP